MSGTIALQGGGPFTANDELDARLLAAAGADQVVVLPTADAFERPERLVAAAMNWAERLERGGGGADGDAPRRGDGEGAANVVRQAKAVYFVGDQPLHLRSVLKDTPLLDALRDVLANGGLVAASRRQRGGDVRPDGRPSRRRLHTGSRSGAQPGAGHRGRDVVARAPAPHPQAGQHRRSPCCAPATRWCASTGWETVGNTEVLGELP